MLRKSFPNFAIHQFDNVMKKQILATESFSSYKRHYFLDFKKAENNSSYIQVTRSEQQEDGSYKRWQIIVFENDFEQFISAFASLFQSAAYQGQGFKNVQQLSADLKQPNGIKAMEPELRPREKLMALGYEKMSNAELLAMLIGSGTPNEPAIALAERILKSVGDDLERLKKMKVADFCKFSGMGIAKSSSVVAALELADRSNKVAIKPNTVYVLKKTGRGRNNFFGYN
jgi:DNA repair protein RadC